MARVEFGDAGDGLGVAARVEVDDVFVGVLEGEDDGVGWEGGEFGVEFLGEGQALEKEMGWGRESVRT